MNDSNAGKGKRDLEYFTVQVPEWFDPTVRQYDKKGSFFTSSLNNSYYHNGKLRKHKEKLEKL